MGKSVHNHWKNELLKSRLKCLHEQFDALIYIIAIPEISNWYCNDRASSSRLP